MPCHTTMDPPAAAEATSVPAELAARVEWDTHAARFRIEHPAANDNQPPVGRGLVRMPAQAVWRWGVAPDDADALFRSLAGWLALFAASSSALAHAWR